jgi:signal transduction histidine kinase
MLKEDYSGKVLAGEGLDFLDRLTHAAARMDRLIEDLLSYSRVARADIHLHPVEVSSLLSEIRGHLSAEIAEKKARVEVQGDLPPVLGDPVLLTQALTNLLSNALKFVPPGQAPEVTVSAERRESFIRLNIRDKGIGIAPTHRTKMFQIFERLQPEEYPGTGVGLAIVKKAVEVMKGRLGFDSEPGHGSCFWIELPAAAP